MKCEGLPVRVDLCAYRGDTWAQTFRFVDSDGEPIDLSAATVASWARSSDGEETATMLAASNGTPGQVTIGQPEGGLRVGNWQYDVEVTSDDGTVTTWVRGHLRVNQDVTNAGGVG